MSFVFVTGTRRELTTVHRFQVASVLQPFQGTSQLVTGGCPTGVDSYAATSWTWRGVLTVPAMWDLYGRAAGPRRNQQLVDMALTLRRGGHRVLWFGFPLGPSKGTRGCLELAETAGFAPKVVELVPGPPSR